MKLLIFIVIGIVAGLLVLAGIMALIGSRLMRSRVSQSTFVKKQNTER
jgi:nitrate reductase gamma subunit